MTSAAEVAEEEAVEAADLTAAVASVSSSFTLPPTPTPAPPRARGAGRVLPALLLLVLLPSFLTLLAFLAFLVDVLRLLEGGAGCPSSDVPSGLLPLISALRLRGTFLGPLFCRLLIFALGLPLPFLDATAFALILDLGLVLGFFDVRAFGEEEK